MYETAVRQWSHVWDTFVGPNLESSQKLPKNGSNSVVKHTTYANFDSENDQ